MVKIEDNSFFFTVLKGTLDGYPRIIVTKWQEMGNEQMHDKDGREIFTEFFYIYIYIFCILKQANILPIQNIIKRNTSIYSQGSYIYKL